MKAKSIFAACAMFALAACADVNNPLTSRDTGETTPLLSPNLRTVSQSFAAAMRDLQVREGVRDAMRASPVSEHKLVLQDYLRTQNGNLLLQAASASARMTPEAMLKLVDELPAMDFYVPVREHRLTWRATENVMVAASARSDASVVTGFLPDGRSVTVDSRKAIPGGRALIMIHPEEPKYKRIHPQADRPGPVIQDAEDGEKGGQITTVNSNGDTTRVSFADLASGGALPKSSESLFQTTATASSSTLATYLASFYAYFGDGVGSCEIRWTTEIYDPYTGAVRTRAYVEQGSIPCPYIVWDVAYSADGPLPLIYDEPVYPENVRVHVTELDSFSNDYFGYANWFEGNKGSEQYFKKDGGSNNGWMYVGW